MRYPNQEAPNVTTPQQQPSVQPQAQQINPNISMASQFTPNAVAAAPQIRPPSNTGVPPLTDHQKKIVAEFKAKIANLPLHEQSAYIAQNKVNLIKQLNFQPNQLRILQNGQPPPQQQHPQNAQIRPTQAQLLHPNQQQQQQQPGCEPAVRPTQPVIMGIQVLQPNSTPGVLPVTVNPLPNMPQPLPTHVQPTQVDTTRRPQVPTIDKTKKIAWVEAQIKKDQHEALNPNYRTPFRSKEDACKRLLRYYVFHEPAPDIKEIVNANDEFEKKSEGLLSR